MTLHNKNRPDRIEPDTFDLLLFPLKKKVVLLGFIVILHSNLYMQNKAKQLERFFREKSHEEYCSHL